jgi:transcriptional regulator with XRE-family HTH domain
MNIKKQKTTPLPVLSALRKLGQDIHDARRRRRIPTALMAERANITRVTLQKIEKGSPSVLMEHYATVLFILGLNEKLKDIADVRFDTVGQSIDEENLPQRIRSRKRKEEKS